ncbi:ABC transporter permease subunit [Brevibacillus fluminis]|uniref:Glutathione transport system permease protein GsiD n=1 Tax=Brevibacillus fluminis TaxID=511487 RepID=A0A3M8DHV0_9BACL|nr:ABC transporter permease subunit [Brevibacillus fluminis]RNB87700.1 ABC transporter permease subunit [Brevibacillus fluminis]
MSASVQLKPLSQQQTEEELFSPRREFFRKFRAQKLAFYSLFLVLLIGLTALFGAYLTPYSPSEPDYNAVLMPPSLSHWAGTDHFGRDILSRIIAGTQISLLVGVMSVFFGALLGTLIGLTSGYFGGWYDSLMMKLTDVMFAFPGILLAIGLIAVLGTGLSNVVIAVSIFTLPIFIRIVRASTLTFTNMTYIEAARSIGVKDWSIMYRHILPQVLPVIIVYLSMRIGVAILIGASLSFLGLGADPSTPEWGAMLSTSRDYVTVAPHVVFFPGLAIIITVLAFNVLGDGLRDALDTKLKE